MQLLLKRFHDLLPEVKEALMSWYHRSSVSTHQLQRR